MYEKHFHLTAAPFNLNPDPQFLYATDTVKEALATLAYGIANRKGFVLLTGDVRTGKTTLLFVRPLRISSFRSFSPGRMSWITFLRARRSDS